MPRKDQKKISKVINNMELTEFEIGLLNRIKKVTGYGMSDSFIADLRKIMPPTCTKTERKFLDEIKRNGKIDSDGYLVFSSYEPYNDSPGTQLDQSDFEANLSELVEKKDE
jgi:hypothetical protein